MPVFLLLLLLLACLPGNWPSPWHLEWGLGTGMAIAATLAAMVLGVGGARILAYRLRRQLEHEGFEREAVIRSYSRCRFYHGLLLVLLYGIALFVFGWGWAVQNLCSLDNAAYAGILLPGAELLILAPYLVMVLLSWACFYDADRCLHERSGTRTEYWTRWGYVFFRARQSLGLVVAPLVLMVLLRALQWWLPVDDSDGMAKSIGLALVLPVIVCFPLVLRWIWGLKPLPDGPLRARLLRAAKRLRVRCSNILIWDTHGAVANAMVAGLLPLPRYVVLTDRLIQELRPDEVEAVFGHELGHVRHHHMTCYLTFLLLSVLVLALGCDLAAEKLPVLRSLLAGNDYWTNLPLVGVVVAYLFVVFGFLSRRCERQADIFGCRAVSCGQPSCAGHAEVELALSANALCSTGIRTFIEALEKVAHINGINRDRPGWLQSWLHSTFARRIEFLERILADQKVEERFQRTVLRVKWGLVIGLGLAVAVLFAIVQSITPS
jgi:Zn-dependent protease with chaperone function